MTTPDGFAYIPKFLTPSEQATLLVQLRELAFAHDTFRGQQLKRSYAQFGYAYGSTGRKLQPAPSFPTFLHDLISKALPHCPVGTAFDQCIITHYPAGAGIGWHTDAPAFGDCIIAVSLAGMARLQFRPNGSTPVSHEQIAEPGSLYVMRGTARQDYQHQVPAVKTDRYSLTFRSVMHTQ
jgi:alkylated DNA repair protein (DNA oxidative demethylase)